MAQDNLVKQWWRQLRFDIPRIRTHAASRRRVRFVLISIVILVVIITAYAGTVASLEYKSAGWWGVGAILIAYALAFAVRRGMKTRGNAVTLSLSTTPKPSLRNEILDRRRILATLIGRAAYEVGLAHGQTGHLPAGSVRAAQLTRLRKDGLWDSVPPAIRDTLAAPEGSWTAAQTGRALMHLQAVAVLHWALRDDAMLSPLRTAASVNPDTLHSALADPDPDRDTYFLRSLSEIESQVSPTLIYLTRLQNELFKRGELQGDAATQVDPTLDDQAEAYMVYAASTGDADLIAEDLPIGGQLISEAPTQDLLHLRGIAAVRIITLHALLDAIDNQGLWKLDEILLQLASPKT